MQRPIRTIHTDTFSRYGQVLDFSKDFDGAFEILVRESAAPWRIAAYRPQNRESLFLENHPDSMETFEPVRGVSLLLAAENHCPEDFQVFLLDRAVCLKKGIWHDVVALSDEVLLKVTENMEVSCVFHNFEKPVRPVVEWEVDVSRENE